MTLKPYDPDRIDQLSLRVMDLCCRLRSLAQTCRGERLTSVELHDRKALEWLDKLEEWMCRAEGDVVSAKGKQQGRNKALDVSASRAK